MDEKTAQLDMGKLIPALESFVERQIRQPLCFRVFVPTGRWQEAYDLVSGSGIPETAGAPVRVSESVLCPPDQILITKEMPLPWSIGEAEHAGQSHPRPDLDDPPLGAAHTPDPSAAGRGGHPGDSHLHHPPRRDGRPADCAAKRPRDLEGIHGTQHLAHGRRVKALLSAGAVLAIVGGAVALTWAISTWKDDH
jgi:hypothetical protein